MKPRTIYDRRIEVDDAVRDAAHSLYEALRDLLDAVNERPELRDSIESVTVAQAARALDLALGGAEGGSMLAQLVDICESDCFARAAWVNAAGALTQYVSADEDGRMVLTNRIDRTETPWVPGASDLYARDWHVKQEFTD